MPLQFASRSLSDPEKKFPPLEGEALAIIWALDKFRLWTEGHEIILYTDHKPLQYIFTNPGTGGKLIRWALQLQQYDLTIKYIEGKENKLADAVSRMPTGEITSPQGNDAFEVPHYLF